MFKKLQAEEGERDMKERTDTERLDLLQMMSGNYTGRFICRWSALAKGWRLHETGREGSEQDVRKAIDNFLELNGR